MDELDDTHRGFLAALKSAQIMSQEEAQSMLDKIDIAAAATAQPPEQQEQQPQGQQHAAHQTKNDVGCSGASPSPLVLV
jgi:hypothetical protein